LQADVSQPAQVERLFAETEAQLRRVTHFVNNAGAVLRVAGGR
jgi:NAD(P)-dependent dehydrogenase (short-subunit alcohol dehydrogenase family)